MKNKKLYNVIKIVQNQVAGFTNTTQHIDFTGTYEECEKKIQSDSEYFNGTTQIWFLIEEDK